jgi:DNA mismatch repair ATPase MutL
MTASQELHGKLKQLQHLLRHQVPGGDLAVIIERAVHQLLEKTLKQRFAQVAKPRSSVSERESGIRPRVDAAAEAQVAATAEASPHEPAATESARQTKAAKTHAGAAHWVAAAAKDAPTREPVAESAQPNETRRKEARSRYIPRAVVREVFARDGAQCTFISASGQRCAERGMLELHHIHAFALGGSSTVENLAVVCRAHNGFFAAQDFGAEHMQKKRASLKASGDQPVLF